MSLSYFLSILDYFGVAIFAMTGALVAARNRHDIVTFTAFAMLTGVGGGTLRDLLIGAPVFWIRASSYLWVCLGIGTIIWAVGERPSRLRLLIWLDGIGISAYSVLGAAKALQAGVAPVAAILMGVLTATFGGIMRDLCAGEPSALLRREFYISAAIFGASLFVILQTLGLETWASGIVAFAIGTGFRAGAIAFEWSLPGFDGNRR